MLLARFKVKGHSMEPFLLDNQIVLTSPIPFIFSKPKVGDVVVFKVGDGIYIKRVKEIRNQKFFLIGDNKEDSLDSRKIGWIERKDIIGKVIHKIATSH